MIPTAWIYSNQFEFWPPQLHQYLHPQSTYHLGSRTYPLPPASIAYWSVSYYVYSKESRWSRTCSVIVTVKWKCLCWFWVQSPTEQINMVRCRVEEVDRSCDSDVDSSEEDSTSERYTLALWPASDSPTYLLLSSRQNKVKIWFCFASIMCCIFSMWFLIVVLPSVLWHCMLIDVRKSIWTITRRPASADRTARRQFQATDQPVSRMQATTISR